MDRFSKWSVVLLMVSLSLTELHSIVDSLWPTFAQTKVCLFKAIDMKLSVEWYLKFTFDDLFIITLSFVAAKIAKRYSYKLSTVLHTVFWYGVADLILFYYNYKSSFRSYWMLLAAIIICTLLIVRPVRERAKVRAME